MYLTTKKKYFIILFLFFSLLPLPLAAQAAPLTCQTGDWTNVYFENGINATFTQAYKSRNLLKDAYKDDREAHFPGQIFTFKTAYNYSAGFRNDVIETFIQKIDEDQGTGGPALTPEEYLRIIETGRQVRFNSTLLNVLRDAYLGVAKLRFIQVSTNQATIQKYRNDLLAGQRVIVVAHSQGNLFANSSVETVIALEPDKSDSIAIIGVASPANRVIGRNVYFTANDDRVINALRARNDVLPANVRNDPGILNDHRDILHHTFDKSYFDPRLISRGLIDTEFFFQTTVMPFPLAEVGAGALRVTLEWGAEPDVDLHVFEPNGFHVFYSQLVGISGFLDLDDVTSFGPENYFVSCETLETGIYNVGVNYFRGTGPEVARVQITTADGITLSKETPLSIARGSAGDDTPISVATIEVTQDVVTENFSFEIQ